MTDIQFSINWDSYHNYVSKGFSSLQQNGEFVDMTLAADGRLVKVHQNIVALASPYLKAMLQSAICQHPVIFLNNISSDILGYILEYIYTGEVKIPTNIMEAFVKACQSLYINGLDTITTPKSTHASEAMPANVRIDEPAANDIAARITINTHDNNNYDFEVIPNDNTIVTNNKVMIIPEEPSSPSHDNDKINNDGKSSDIVNISSINNFVVLEPNADIYNNVGLNKINFGSDDKLLTNICLSGLSHNSDIEKTADIKTITDNCQKESKQSNSCVQLQENPIIMPISNDDWHINSASNIVNKEITISEEQNLPNIAMNAGDWSVQEHTWNPDTNILNVSTLKDFREPESGQSNVHTELDSQIPQDTFDDLMDIEDVELPPKLIKVKNSKVLKSLKMIGTHMKLKNQTENLPTITLNRSGRMKMDILPHFTISNRGALQLILNRFLYHTHHYSRGGRKRRWRCVDYRKLHCPAFIDTNNEEIMAMSVEHLHPNHENIVKKKIKANIVFTSLSLAVHTINTYITNQEHQTKSIKEKSKKARNTRVIDR